MEKALLVGIKFKSEKIPIEESLEELKQLAKTAGAETVGVLTQQKDFPDLKYFIGTGKLEELKALCEETQADLVVFDHDIFPSQTRNLEEALGVKVINRTELILDIFALHAHTKEGKLQVKLAQAEYGLTHLTGHGTELSRLGGGIGTRGPGETKLEVDRRKIRKDISDYKKELSKVQKSRGLLREKRKGSELKTISLVGYTNSGKSTLLNSLTNAKVLAENKLFATLDPVTRRIYLPTGQIALLTDTVGFIQKLPHTLISAFRATLEETIEADILLHVVDASSLYIQDQIDAVYNVLEELKAVSKPIITVFNKIDIVKDKEKIEILSDKYSPSVIISAYYNEGLDELLKLLDQQLLLLRQPGA